MTKKRIVALLLVAVLALSLVVMPAPNAEAAGEYTIRLADANGNSEITAEPGDTVVLSLSIENNPGIIAVAAQMAYPSQLSLTKAELPAMDMMNMYSTGKFMPSFTNSQTLAVNPYLVWMNQATGTMERKLVTYNGKIHELTFQIADDAAAGEYTITLSAPTDKNTTASVDGSGIILSNTNAAVTNIALVNFTIKIEAEECAPDAHVWGDWADVEGSEATCDAGGKQSRTCSVCGKPEEKDVPATGHSYTQYTESKAATCVDNKEETATCDNGCGTTDTREVANTATGEHTFQGQSYIDKDPATCLANGTHYRKCAVCGAEEAAVEKENSKLEHSYTGTTLTYKATDANCHEKATYYHVCVNGCGGQGTTTFEAGEVDKTKHDGETQLRNQKAPSETEEGYTGDLYCLGCGDMIQKGEVIKKLDHTHQMTKTDAKDETCTEDGNIEYYTCSKCNKTYADAQGITEVTDVVIPATHKLTKTAKVEATCTEAGNIEYYTCAACQKKFSDAEGKNEVTNVVVAAKGHSMTKTAKVEATCTEPGNIEYYTCGTCGKKYSDANGSTEVANVVIAAKGHSMTKTEAKAETCTENGNIEYYTCGTCGKLYKDAEGKTEIKLADTVIPAAHKLTKTAKVEATCTEPGNIEYYTCSVCQKKFSDAEGKTEVTETVIAALGHDIQKVDAKDATCDEQGNIAHYACVNGCGTCYEDAEGTKVLEASVVYQPALGHKLVEHKAVDATVDAEGSIAYYECETCDKLYKDAKGTEEIKKEDTVVSKLPKPESATPANGDSFDASLWIAVMLLACLSLAVTVVIRKKVIC